MVIRLCSLPVNESSLYPVGKLVFSYTCTVRAPVGVSIALDQAFIDKRKFTQCVGAVSRLLRTTGACTSL